MQDALRKALKAKFSEYGFKKRGNGWHRCQGDVHVVVNLEKSQLVDGWYINVGISLLSMFEDIWLSEVRSPIRFRVEEFDGLRAKARLLDADAGRSLGAEAWLSGVVNELVQPLVVALVAIKDHAGLKVFLKESVTDNIFLHRDVRAVLQIGS
ncbi:DUF4304 domain-containing protein [Sphaerisporangium sp. NPDC051017]|uniref:DUF4304 domain-containing protein n=1 Tax=Sphaerisporangium sp. NPDC051017 TaxID=3154636 RepID=UPI003423A0FB